MPTTRVGTIDLLAADATVSTNERYVATRAHWTTPLPCEFGAPAHRIVHSRALMLASPTRLDRLGVRTGHGYFKCGSEPNLIDWVQAFRLLVYTNGEWRTLVEEHDIPRPNRWSPDVASLPVNQRDTAWYDLGGAEVGSVLIEVRRAGVDGWWPSWNLVSTAFVLEGQPASPLPAPPFRAVKSGSISLAGLPTGMSAQRMTGEVRYRTDSLEVGFSLGRPGMTWLSLDDEGRGRHAKNLLAIEPVGLSNLHTRCQGLLIQPVGAPAVAGPSAWDYDGTVTVEGNRVKYRLDMPTCSQRIELDWEVRTDGLTLTVVRHGSREVRVWAGSVWGMTFNAQVAATTTLGAVTRHGQAGMVAVPLLLHAPGYGSLRTTSEGSSVQWRSDAVRPSFVTTTELLVGAIPQPHGDFVLAAGDHSAQVTMDVTRYMAALPPLAAEHHATIHGPLKANVPESVRRAIERCGHTALTYRPDTATLSNNGCSIHSPICADVWGRIAVRIGEVLPGFGGLDMLRDTLQRTFDGGQGYASGAHPFHEKPFELEYLLVDVAMLAGLADYLEAAGDCRSWTDSHAEAIGKIIARLAAADLDGDGLIESDLRTGVSGSRQWCTNWFDVITCGWKDAYVNAVLYDALKRLGPLLSRNEGIAGDLETWAARLKASYRSCFWNDETGWLAGWRCLENKLHDYAFLFVNGAAVNAGLLDADESQAVIARLWAELKASALPHFRWGLPGNVWPIPEQDYALGAMHPFPTYENGAATHSQARHFIGALYAVGMQAEGDEILEAACETLADGTAFSGCGTGVDWRRWDGVPTGYEGILADQFGILAVALDRWREVGAPRHDETSN